jgi:hypothetical protein
MTSSKLSIDKDGHSAVHATPSNPKHLRSAPPGGAKFERPTEGIKGGGQAQFTYGVVCAIDQTISRHGPLDTD